MKDLVAFEWRYHTRQVSFSGACALFLFFGVSLTATGFGPGNININSPFSIMQSVGLLSLMSVFVLAVFCSSAIVRDHEHRMQEIVFSTAVEKQQFLIARFAGAFLASLSVFSFSAVGMMLATLLPSHDPERLGTFLIVPYLWSLLILAVPNLLLATVVLFSIAALTRSLLASAVGAVLIYVLYFAAAAWSNSPLMASSVPGARDGLELASLLDPFGLAAFFEQTRYWTAAERNVRLTSMSGVFLANRALWMGVAAIGWAIVYRFFSFRVARSTRRSKMPRKPVEETRAPHVPYAPVNMDAAFPTRLAAIVSATRIELRTYLRSMPFLAMTLLWAGLAASEIASSVDAGEFGSTLYPTSGLVMAAIQPALLLMGLVIIIYYSAEILWRERTIGMSGIINATPASSTTFIISKWITLCTLVAVLVATGTIVGIGLQFTHDYSAIDWGAAAGFAWFGGAPLIVFAMAAVLVHTITPNKYVGLLIVLILGVLLREAAITGLEHRLWRFGSTPAVEYSEFYGFGPFAAPFNWYLLHWALVGFLCLTLASAFWRNGLRVRGRRPGRSKVFRIAVAVLFLMILLSTGHIFWNTNIRNSYLNQTRLTEWQADYERTYAGMAGLPRPRIEKIEASVDLHPAERRYRVHGRYLLRNETSLPIERVIISIGDEAHDVALSIPGAEITRRDTRFGHYILDIRPPLAAGQSSMLEFDATFGDTGFSETGTDTSIVENGSFLSNLSCFPQFGYRRRNELTDPDGRRRAGLPVKSDDDDGQDLDWPMLDLTVSTASDQVPVTTGALVREWVEGGRRFRHYRTDKPSMGAFVITSGRYKVATALYGDVAIELYYHPTHFHNVERMLRATLVSMQAFEESFGPYPHPQLKIIESPAPGNQFGGIARPDTIFINENRGFLFDMRDADGMDIVARRTAHEVAHQWWGTYLTPRSGVGAAFITETLTKHAELLVLERMYGREAVRQSLTYELDGYLEGRTDEREDERPLLKVDDESFLFYRKGALVMQGLQNLLGAERLNAALKSFFAEESGPGHRPEAEQVLAKLHGVASPEEQQLIDDWLLHVVLYDLEITGVRSTRLADGRYEVIVNVSALKTRNGRDVPFEESVEVGLFVEDPDRTGDATNLVYLAKHELIRGPNTIRALVDRQPGFAAVDPFLTRIDQNRFDNGRDVE